MPVAISSIAGLLFDSIVHFSGGYKCDVQIIKGSEITLIKKTTIASQNYRYAFVVLATDLLGQISDHIGNGVTKIAIFTTTPEDSINNDAIPNDM
jgi:hypothetical protein